MDDWCPHGLIIRLAHRPLFRNILRLVSSLLHGAYNGVGNFLDVAVLLS